MPVYAYECSECGVRFDARQRFTDEPLTVCPECGGRLHRVPQPVGIVFKGSGWYAKDSRGQGTLATPPKKEGEAEGKNGKTSESDSPAAPSTTKDAKDHKESSKSGD